MMGGAAAGEKALESARELLANTGAKGESERRKSPKTGHHTQGPHKRGTRSGT